MEKVSKGLISVIIPVYNASKCLSRCFESIVRQTCRNLEIVFVNDCSTDNSEDCIRSFMNRKEVADLKIKCISHHYNRGVAAARNTGLDNATGEYIYYLDADDYIEDNAIESLCHEADKTEADIVGCEWFLSFSKNERRMIQPVVGNGEELFTKMARGVARWNLWLFMVRRSLYEENGVRFMEKINMGEDMMVMMKLSLYADKVSILNVPLYHYVQTQSDSLTRNWSDGYKDQISLNVGEVEKHVTHNYGNRFNRELDFLKLNIKLPLLISSSTDSYKKWMEWFSEANGSIMYNKDIAFRTRLLQLFAYKRQYWLLKLYYYIVIKFVYGILYR